MPDEDDHEHVTAAQQMISSCSGALITSFLVNPLDVVKIRMQKQVKRNATTTTIPSLEGAVSTGFDTNRKKVERVWVSADLYKKIVLKRYVTPLDVVKVRLQTQQRPMTAGRCFIYCNGLMDHVCHCEPLNVNGSKTANQKAWYARPGQFSGTLDAFIKISRNEGIGSLWSGLPPTLIMAVPATMVYFTMYDNTITALRNSYGFQMWMPILAGGCSRTACVTLISPLEMIRTKMQSEKLKYLEIFKAVKGTIQQRGIQSLWTGLGATLMRDVPFSSFYWLFYELVKPKFKDYAEKSVFMVSFASGAFAGTLAAIITCPFDVIKTHKQIELGELKTAKNQAAVSTSTWRLMARLYKDAGIRGWFTGLTPRVIKVAPACAIMVGAYEYLKNLFKERNRRRRNINY